DTRSRIARAELSREHHWWLWKRFAIEQRYRIVVDDTEFDHPSYQIGSGDERRRFAPGSFAASGSFMLTLHSLCAVDTWERSLPQIDVRQRADGSWSRERDQKNKPEVFPPLPPKPPILTAGGP